MKGLVFIIWNGILVWRKGCYLVPMALCGPKTPPAMTGILRDGLSLNPTLHFHWALQSRPQAKSIFCTPNLQAEAASCLLLQLCWREQPKSLPHRGCNAHHTQAPNPLQVGRATLCRTSPQLVLHIPLHSVQIQESASRFAVAFRKARRKQARCTLSLADIPWLTGSRSDGRRLSCNRCFKTVELSLS